MLEDRLVVVCVGAGSEYPFSVLAQHIQARGVHCLEIDMARPEWRKNAETAMTFPRRVLLTSQHPNSSSVVLNAIYGTAGVDVVPLADAVEMFKPERTIYVPHDLTEPIKVTELFALRHVDVALMPTAEYWFLNRYVRVEQVGWIQTLGPPDEAPLAPVHATFLPTDIGFYSQRPELFAERFGAVLALRPTLKLPPYPNTEPLISIAKEYGCSVLPAATRATAAIAASSIVVTTGVSSILAEASSSGKVTFCIADGVIPLETQRRAVARWPGVNVGSATHVAQALHMMDASGVVSGGGKGSLLQFDLDRALKLILEADVVA